MTWTTTNNQWAGQNNGTAQTTAWGGAQNTTTGGAGSNWSFSTTSTYGAQGQTSGVSGGWTKSENKGFSDNQQSGGWGRKPQSATGGFGNFSATSGFGMSGNAGFGRGTQGRTTGFGTGGFGTSGGFGTGGFGTGGFGTSGGFGTGGFGTSGGFGTGGGFGTSGFNQPQKPKVEISTLGFPFNYSEMQDQSVNGPRKTYRVYHINMIKMFSRYTTEQLRYFDYLSRNSIPIPAAAASLQGTTNFMGTMGGQATTSNAFGTQQQQLSNKPVDWAEVPLKVWGDIAKIPENKIKQAYGALQPTQLDVSTSSTESAAEKIIIHHMVKLKGLYQSETISSRATKADRLELSQTPGISKAQPLELQFQSAKTSSTSTGTTPGSSTRSPTASSNPRRSSHMISVSSSRSSEYNPCHLKFIPNILLPSEKVVNGAIYSMTHVSNLNVFRENYGSIFFPHEIDVSEFDPVNSVKIDFDQSDQIVFSVTLKPKATTSNQSDNENDDEENSGKNSWPNNYLSIVTLDIGSTMSVQTCQNFANECRKKNIQCSLSNDSLIAIAIVPSLDLYPIIVK